MKKKGALHFLQQFLATGFFIGYLPWMPGTFGTLVGLAFFVLLSRYAALYYLMIILLLVISVTVSDYAEKKIFRRKDPGPVVIDEIVGYLIAMTSFHFTNTLEGYKFMIIGFILFRIFDIWKPYPIRQTQKLRGGIGIVMDDVMAGIITNLLLQFLRLSETQMIRFL